MPQTITKTVYEFSELSEHAQKRAMDWYRNLRAEDWTPDDLEHVIENAERMGEILGITIDHGRTNTGQAHNSAQVDYDLSGHYAQSVGFNGSYAYRKGAAKTIRAEAPLDTSLHAIADTLQELQRRYFYGLSALIRADRDPDISVMAIDATGMDVCADVNDDLEEILQDFAHWVYCQLEAEHECQNTEEYLREEIAANEYTFDAEGNRSD